MPRHLTSALLIALLLGACATLPDKVKPAATAANLYQGADCAKLDSERQRLNAAYEDVSRRQFRTRKVDAVGLVLLGLPVGSLTGGSHTKSIAAIKGRQEALSDAYRASNCSGA